MNAFIKKSLGGIVLAGWLVMGLNLRSAAAGIAVSPLKQEISLRPGDEGKVELTLAYNNRVDTDITQKMHVSIVDVQATEEGSLTFKDPGALANSASKWITLSETDLVLEPKQSKKIECKIAVPQTAPSGEYYAAVMVTLATKGVNEKGVIVQYRIASGVFVTVLGRTFPKEAKITRCELIWPQSSAATQPAATQPAEETATAPPPPQTVPVVKVMLENTGQARFDGSGKMTIVDNQSRPVFSAPLTTRRPTVFGGDSRLFEAPVTRTLPAGRYTIRVEMDYESTWAKARQDLRVEVLPEQAALLGLLKEREGKQARVVEATPDNLECTIPAGATRSLAITLKNLSESAVTCKATASPAVADGKSEAWVVVRPEPFSIQRSSKKTIEVRVQAPANAAPGKYSAIVSVDTGVDGASPSQVAIPVDFEIRTEH